ncbi:MAG: DUF3169 family protein [Cellulosilyticaceae bacterium]
MKDYKWKKFAITMVVAIVVGLMIGVSLRFLLATGNFEVIIENVVAVAPYTYVVATVFGVLSLLGYCYFNIKLKKENYSNEEDSFYERHEIALSIFMILATLCVIVNFTAMGLNMNTSSPLHILIGVNVILGFVGEVAYISLIKKVRPELNADPTDLKFSKSYFDKLDECEKNKVGKSCFQTMTAMMIVYIGMFMFCYLLTLVFDVSPIVCLPVGMIWFIQTILSTYYGSKK